jgi:hypothetical protein
MLTVTHFVSGLSFINVWKLILPEKESRDDANSFRGPSFHQIRRFGVVRAAGSRNLSEVRGS